MSTIIKQLSTEDAVNIEKATYEVQVNYNMIDYFIQILKDRNCSEKFHEYIDEYSEDLKLAELHKLMLSTRLMNNYFPQEWYDKKDFTTYRIDSNDGVIVYELQEQE